jgi:hypothetical protein
MKFAADGTFIRTIGETGYGPGSSSSRTRLPWTRRGGSSSPTATTTASRSCPGGRVHRVVDAVRPAQRHLHRRERHHLRGRLGVRPGGEPVHRPAQRRLGARHPHRRRPHGWVFHFIPETWNRPNLNVNSFSGPEGRGGGPRRQRLRRRGLAAAGREASRSLKKYSGPRDPRLRRGCPGLARSEQGTMTSRSSAGTAAEGRGPRKRDAAMTRNPPAPNTMMLNLTRPWVGVARPHLRRWSS